MAQADWDGAHAVYARGPAARTFSQSYGQSGSTYAAQYGAPRQPETPPGDQYGQPPAYFGGSEALEAAPALGATLSRAAAMAGAVLSLALVAGLGVWGYKLALRDVTGIPVVRALDGPMRIRPQDPGGLAVAHQGLAVNAVTAGGVAAGPTEQVTLAPSPASLSAEDVPAHVDATVSATLAAEADEVSPVTPEADVAPQDAAFSVAADDAVAQALAMADRLAASAAPLSGDQSDLAMTPGAETRLAAAIVPASVPGVALSPRPAPRPEGLATRAALRPADMVPLSASVTEVPATEIAAGTRLVQLGAYDSEEVARAAWDTLATRFDAMLTGKDRVIEMAQSGGKTFYRLRAMGFTDLSDARRFCAALMAGQAPCIPVVTR